MFAVNIFYKYVFGWLFTVTTDHKPLLGLFQERKAISEMVFSRIQCWGWQPTCTTYDTGHARSQNGNAGALSHGAVRRISSNDSMDKKLKRVKIVNRFSCPFVGND